MIVNKFSNAEQFRPREIINFLVQVTRHVICITCGLSASHAGELLIILSQAIHEITLFKLFSVIQFKCFSVRSWIKYICTIRFIFIEAVYLWKKLYLWNRLWSRSMINWLSLKTNIFDVELDTYFELILQILSAKAEVATFTATSTAPNVSVNRLIVLTWRTLDTILNKTETQFTKSWWTSKADWDTGVINFMEIFLKYYVSSANIFSRFYATFVSIWFDADVNLSLLQSDKVFSNL